MKMLNNIFNGANIYLEHGATNKTSGPPFSSTIRTLGHPNISSTTLGLHFSSTMRTLRHPGLLFLITIYVILVISGQVEASRKLESKYTNMPALQNKKYLYPIATRSYKLEVECKNFCGWNPICFAYAFSAFARNCELYKFRPGVKAIIAYSYVLRVVLKSEDEGFYVFGSIYIKLFTDRLTASQANKQCKTYNGMLLAITSDQMNQKVFSIMQEVFVPYAHIGVTDQKQEMSWMYYDGTPASYQNWLYNGMWNRTDYNCAFITTASKGQWKQISCDDQFYYFCQVPIY